MLGSHSWSNWTTAMDESWLLTLRRRRRCNPGSRARARQRGEAPAPGDGELATEARPLPDPQLHEAIGSKRSSRSRPMLDARARQVARPKRTCTTVALLD